MNAQAFTIANVQEWLLHSPAYSETMNRPKLLRGFIVNHLFFCWRCTARLSARGIILPPQSRPVWRDRNPELAVCAACGNPEKAQA